MMSRNRILQDLAEFGPDADRSRPSLGLEAARERATALTLSHRENFSVLTRLVPTDVRPDFAAVYAFCRTADDLGDEMGDPEVAARLLGWWREEIERAWAGDPGHWVFVALQPTIERFQLDPRPFLDLVSAFEQDQLVTRYETWDQLIDYCTRSADPVGRLVLRLLEQPFDDEIARRSDAICTALQLTNHWQDLKRDLLERDRCTCPECGDRRLRGRCGERRTGLGDPEFEEAATGSGCVERTWPSSRRVPSCPTCSTRRRAPWSRSWAAARRSCG